MKELLEKINQTFDNSINTSSEEVGLQLKIIKGNINTLFKEAMEKESAPVAPAPKPAVQVPTPKPVAPAAPVAPTPKPVAPAAPVAPTPTPQPAAPVAPVASAPTPQPAAPVAPKPAAPATPVAPKPATPVNKKKILIVDDSSIVRNFLQKAIGDKFEVTSLSGGADAISNLAENKYDLIFLDLMMPGIDGFGVLDNLKETNNTTPVVIISGDDTKETIDRAFTYNVVDMVGKPFSNSVIMDKIDRILG